MNRHSSFVLEYGLGKSGERHSEKVIDPSLHHCRTRLQIWRVITGCTRVIPFFIRRPQLDVFVWPACREGCGGFASEIMAGHAAPVGFTDRALVFHTLRNSFMQRCENAGVPESTVKLIVGHSRQGSMTYGLYSPGPDFEKLRAGVRKVRYGKADSVATGA